MRTALSVAALAAGALAVPYKRDVVYTDWDVVYVTDVVTVTAGQAPAYSSASSSSEASVAQHYGHHNHPHSAVWTSASATTWTEIASPSSTSTSSPAPAYTPSPSSTPEPENSTSTTSTTPSSTSTSITSVYQIPLTTYVPVPTSTYVAPKSSAAVPTISASAGGYGSADATYGKAVLDSHNLHRSNHSASDIEWDDELYNIAVSIAQTCVYKHNTTAGGGGYGQNIAAGVDMDNIDSVITDMFYNGEEWQFADAGLYGEANPDMSNFEAWGHFTQLVWKDTTHVACYTTTKSDCPTIYDSDGNDLSKDSIPPYFTVCNYKNPGNYAGEYADNVGKPLGQPISYASSSS